MASITVPAAAGHSSPLRPLNILRDLPQVADLIELCFESTMDEDGQSYVQQMRTASKDQAFLQWAGKVMESTSMPLAGYVWEDDGRIVGNVSLVYQAYRGRKLAMIANVATHPQHRRQGIGRALTERAMLAAWQKGTEEIWLQVRDENLTAIHIYEELGFRERARRSTFVTHSTLTGWTPSDLSGSGPRPRVLRIARPQARHWPTLRRWLEEEHPTEMGWYASWNWDRLGPGVKNALYRLFVQYDTRQWGAFDEDELLASAVISPAYRQPNAIWLAAGEGQGEAVTRVLEAARRDLAHWRRLTVEYPVNEYKDEIEAAGFTLFRTLMWMRATHGEFVRRYSKKEN